MYPEPAKMAEKPSLKAKGGTASVGAKREEARNAPDNVQDGHL